MSGIFGGDAAEVFATRLLSKEAKIATTHVEGHAAAEMVRDGLLESTIHINMDTGPCQFCIKGIPQLLGEGQKLWVAFKNGVGYFTNQGWTRLF